MSYRLSEEEALLQRTVRSFAREKLAPLVEEAEKSGRFPRDQILPGMAELGLLSIGVPPELGGVGGSSLMLCVVAEEIARVCGGFAISVMASVLSPGAVVAMSGGSAPASLLAPLLEGRILPAMAFTEPGAGSDLLAIRTVARKTERGVVLDGEKTFISNGPTADAYLVAAVRSDYADLPRSERGRGMGLYLVTRGSPGLELGKPMAKLGMRSSETGALYFDSVLVTARLGAGLGKAAGAAKASPSSASGGEGGFGGMMKLLDFNRLYIGALSLGVAQAAFEASLAYVREREAFGKPIGHHQATGFKVARMSARLDAARALVQRACEMYDAGEPCTRQISEAKLLATETAVDITGDAVQIHGGYGYVEESPVERYFRDAKVGTIWEGTSEIQQHVICRELGVYS